MRYKTDLHCHTCLVSKCADLALEEMVENYIKLGYTTMVITDHFSSATFEDMHEYSWNDKCEFYVSGYKRACKIANGRINILLGMEYRNIYTSNDYLVYGVTEEFLKKYNIDDKNNILNMHLKEFTDIAHKDNMLVYQAHPFRNSMTVLKPGNTDGIEVLNAHKGHDSRNEIAMQWAKKYNLLTCGGSDCHHKGAEGRGGIETTTPITNNRELISALKGDFTIIDPGDLH